MRFKTVCSASIGLVALAVGGCASGGAGAGGGSSSLATDAASGKVGVAVLQWSGNFRATEQQTSDIAIHMRNQASGNVVITAANASQIRVRIQAGLPDNNPVRLAWDIASGGCGADAIPLLAVAQFPQLPMSNGRGTLDELISVAFPTTGTYHVNVFKENTDGSDQSDVLACADLSLARRSN
ncbi:MAG TPA: hypothetical protein VIJ16_08165 [Gemmatimonadaceae bacterium]